MNRIQFWILTGLSGVVLLLLVGHIFLVRQTNFEQNRLVAVQQAVNQGQAFQSNFKQLAVRIYQLSQQSQDPGLKELLVRQQIAISPGDSTSTSTNTTETPGAPAPTPAPAPAH